MAKPRKNLERNKKFIPPHLSQRDQYLPKGYISLTEVFVLSKEMRELYGEAVGDRLRKDTFRNVDILFNKYNADDYAKFFNANLETINAMGLNEFAKFEPIQELCEYIECHSTVLRNKSTKVTSKLISFGFDEEVLKEYIRRKNQSIKTGLKFVPPKRKKYTLKEKIAVLQGEHVMRKIDGESIENVPRNAVVKRFKDWCYLKDITQTDGILQAFDLIVKSNPIDKLKDLENYRLETVFEEFELAIKPEKKRDNLNVTLDANLIKQVEDIVIRYNQDPENHSRVAMGVEDFVDEALRLMVSKMPLKYSSPELLREYEEVKKHEEYVNNQFEKGENNV